MHRRDGDGLDFCEDDETDQTPATGCIPANPYIVTRDNVAAWKQQTIETKESTLMQWATRVLVDHSTGERRSRADISLKKHVLKLIIPKCARAGARVSPGAAAALALAPSPSPLAPPPPPTARAALSRTCAARGRLMRRYKCRTLKHANHRKAYQLGIHIATQRCCSVWDAADSESCDKEKVQFCLEGTIKLFDPGTCRPEIPLPPPFPAADAPFSSSKVSTILTEVAMGSERAVHRG